MDNNLDPRVAALAALFQNPAPATETAPAAEPRVVVVTNLRLTAEAGDPESARITGFVPELNADCLLAGNADEAEKFLTVAKPGDANRREVDIPADPAKKREAKHLVFVERDLLAVRCTATVVGAVREAKTANGKVRRTVTVRDAVVTKVGFKPTGKWALG